MARFRKAVDSALWVQLALVVCYAPMYTVEIVVTRTNKYSLLLVVLRKVAIILLPSYIILPGNSRIVHKDFLHSQISPSTSTRSTTAEPNKCTEHGAI